MALPVWGNLQKSQIDPEKIEEAIARLIQAHEDDPNAHVEAGESLYSHKAAEIIDHIIASIIADKIKDGEVIAPKIGFIEFSTFFESVDGYDPTPGVSFELSTLVLETTGDINNLQHIGKALPMEIYGLSWDKNRFIEIFFMTDSVADIECVLCAGSLGANERIGFKIIDNKVYGVTHDGTTETTVELSGILPDDRNLGRIVFTAGEKCEFYINGVLKGTISTDLPSGTTFAHYIINTYVKNTAFAAKKLYIGSWDFKQNI